MNEKKTRKIYFYKRYFLKFYDKLDSRAKLKFDWTLKLITEVEQIPRKYFRHIEGRSGLYEIRVDVGSNIFRVFCFFDKDQLIILINGFQKKSQKTPKKEIEIAERIKNQYYEDKEE